MANNYTLSRLFILFSRSVLTGLFLLLVGALLSPDAQAQVTGRVFRANVLRCCLLALGLILFLPTTKTMAQCAPTSPSVAAQSSVYDAGATVDNLSDGSFQTGAGTDAPGGTQWVRLDFGSIVGMTAVKLSPLNRSGWAPSDLNGASLQVSNDASTWTNVLTISGMTNNVLTTIPITATGRYIRISRGTYIGVSEFQVTTNGLTVQAVSGPAYVGQPLNLSAVVSPVGSYTYAWSGLPGVTITPTNTANPVATGMAFGVSSFTLVVTTSPTCQRTVFLDVDVHNPPCTSAGIGGTVFSDFNGNGITDTYDLGISNVTVSLFSCDGTGAGIQVATAQTDLYGEYTFTGLTAGTDYRVEFSNLPAGYQPTYRGTNNGTTVQFARPGSCSVSLGLNQPADYCQANPTVVLPCFVNGAATNSGVTNQNTIVSIPYSASSVTPMSQNTYLSQSGKTGTVYGTAYKRDTRMVYMSAFMKRHTGLLDNNGDNLGDLGAIYQLNTATNVVTLFTTVPNAGTIANDAGRGLAGFTASSRDVAAFGLVGKAGLGDLDISDDGQYLYTINLNTRQLVRINVATQAQDTYTLPTDACPNGVRRPFGLAVRRGIVYVGTVCTAESSGGTVGNMEARVYAFDGSTFTSVLDFPLNYAKGFATGVATSNTWHPWTDNESVVFTTANGTQSMSYPQPILSDIVFDEQGYMSLGFMDRGGNQVGNANLPPSINNTLYVYHSGGDMLIATPNSTQTSWTIESNGSKGGGYRAIPAQQNNQGPGGGEFYYKESFPPHEETNQGGLAALLGSGSIMTTAFDLNFVYQGGVRVYNTKDASVNNDYVIFDSYTPTNFGQNPGTFGKSNGLGDPELLCNPAPIQIGNRVWRDDNKNGLQDPCEPAIPGAVVRLYNAAKTTIIASATTNAAGEFYFQSATVVAGASTSAVTTTALTANASYALVISSLGTSTVVTGTGQFLSIVNVSPLTPGESSTANSGNTLANNDARLDLVGGVSLPCIKLTTGGMGANNHTYDFGFSPIVCSLSVTVGGNFTTCNGGSTQLTANPTGGSAPYSYSWTPSTGLSSTTVANPIASPTASITYTVRVTAADGCVSSTTVAVTVKPTPTITFTAPASATTTVCANTTLNMSVTSNAVAPDQIRFVYFTEPLASPADAYTASGGAVLGTITSGTATGTKTVTLPNAQLPDNQGDVSSVIYVYAILESADGLCQPVAQRVIVLNPRPIPSISADPQICQGSSATLTASGPVGMTFQWFFNNGTTAVSTANPYNTTAINATATYRLRGTLSGCVSDDVQIALTPVPCTPCVSNSATIGGIVYRDFNSDGINTAQPGIGAVTVTIFRCDAGGSSVQVAQMQTDIKGQYSFTGLTGGTSYRVEFSNLPAGYEPTYKGTNNGTTAQFVLPGTCNASLGLNRPADYCQANPRLVTPCYIDGAVAPNITAMNDVLVGFDYNVVGSSPTNKTIDATRTDIGSTWGLAYAKSTQQLYASAFLKRHIGLKDAKLGQIYVKNYNTPSAAPTPWLDISTLPGIAGSWTYLTDAQRGLGNAGSPSLDADAFDKIALTGIGDIDISDDDKTLFVMDLTNRQLLSIDIATKTLNSRTPVPDVCTGTAGPAYYTASSTSFTATDGNVWRNGIVFNTDNNALEYGQTITNPSSASAGTTDAALYATSVYTPTSLAYNFPMGNGSYSVKMHFATNLSITNRNTTVQVESTTVISGLDVYAASGNQVNLGLTRSFTATVTDGVLSISVINGSGSSFAAVSGFEITPISGQAKGVTRPFATKYRDGKVYVGAVCDASFSQNRDDLQASVFVFDPTANSFSATPVISYPLTYLRGASVGASKTGSNNRWEPWTSVYPNNSVAGIRYDYAVNFDVYTQPVFSDIEFDIDGSMIMGFFDRFGNQMGATPNYRPDRPTSAGLTSSYGVVGGDVLRAYANGTSFELENNAKEGINSSKAPSAGGNNLQGPGGGEFYLGDALPDVHNETSMGGLALLPGSNELRLTSGDPLAASSGGILALNNLNGAKIIGSSFTLYSGAGGGVQFKANGLGDLELLCNVAPIQIGNRVWRDDNRNGIQDPCEPPIAGAVVKLYDAAKTTVLASVTTNAAGEYYFSSTTITAGNSTSSVATSLLTYNTTYGLVITSLGTSTVVTSQGLLLTDVSPVTPGESGTLNSGTTQVNNDAKVDAGLPCIKLTTGGPGTSNHTYDFGIAKVFCSLTATASASSQTLTSGQPVTLTAQVSPTGSYTYVWVGPGTITPTNAATVTASNLPTGVNTFTVTVSSSPICFTTATVSVTVLTSVLAVVVGTPICNTLTNNYTASGTVSLTNSPAGSLTITDNGMTIAVLTITAGQTTASFSVTGASGSSPALHTVLAVLNTITTSTTYATPASCTVCSLSATASAAVTICAGQSATLTATALGGTAGYSYGWQPAASLSGVNTATAIATPTVTTTYTVIVTDAKNCTALATVTVTVNGQPAISSLVRGTCVGNLVSVTANASLTGAGTLEYSFNGGAFQPANTTTITANGPTLVTVVVRTMGSSCSVNQSIMIDCACQTPANVSLLPASPATCGQTPVSLTASVGGGATSATLTSSGTGTFSNALVMGSATVTYTPSVADVTAGSVTLTITSADPDGVGSCLVATQSRVLLINPVPTIMLSSTTVCAGASASLTATGGANAYTFAPAGGVQTGNVYVVAINTTTVYSVTGTTGTCSNTASGTVTILPKPTVGGNQTLVCANGVVPGSTTLTAQTNSSVLTGQWFAQPGNPNATTFANATSLTTTVSGLLPGQTYQFVWANTNSCADDVIVTVGTCPTVAVGSIGDFVWKDANSNGIQDDGPNSGMSNVRVNLLKETTTPGQFTVVAVTTTTTSGFYNFTGLSAGNYVVQVDVNTVPFYCQPTTQTVVTPNDATNSKIDDLGETPVITINPADPNQRDYPKADAGFSPLPLGSIGDYVWKDTNNDGIQNDGSTGVANVGLKLLNGDGNYVITGPLSGAQENPPVSTNGTGLVYATFDGTTNQLDLLIGFSNLNGTVTMAHIHTGVVGANGPVIVDLVALGFPTGVQGGNFMATTTLTAAQKTLLLANKLYVNVHTSTNGGGEVRAQLVTCAFSNTAGAYLFANLPQGTYTVAVDTPTLPLSCIVSSKQNSTSATEATDSDFSPITGLSDPVAVVPTDPNQRDIRTVDLALVNPTTGSLGNFVWKDNNNNGLQDANEPGVEGVMVQLFTVVGGTRSSTPVATTTTSTSGLYGFANLPQGDYQVRFTLPTSLTGDCQITPLQNAGDDTRDSDVDPNTGFSPVVTINPNGTGLAVNNPTIDLGLQRRIYDPVGYIYCFANNTILTGGRISVTGPGSISIIKDGSDGSYQFFTDGTPGLYTLTYTHPGGYSIATTQRPVAASVVTPTGLEGTPADRDGVPDGSVQLGSKANSALNPTSLLDGSAGGNPYYLVFNVRAGDPYLVDNNLPIDCTIACPVICIPITIGQIR